MVPMKSDAGTVTKPAAGVIATKPTTAPIQKPSAETFLPLAASKRTQARPAAPAAVLVVAKADTANGEAVRAEPALKPNHPNHSKPVPNNTNGMFAGGSTWSSRSDLRRFRYNAPANAAQPADM